LTIFGRSWSAFLRPHDAGAEPPSGRLEQNLRDYDIKGEQSIALAQGAVACLVLALHAFARFMSGMPLVDSWVTLALGLLIASSCLRWEIAASRALPERLLDALNVIDVGIFLALIWGYQYAYDLPAGAILKAPSFVLVLVLIGLRALRFHPRPIAIVGLASALGWAVLVLGAVAHDGTDALTHDYREYFNTPKIFFWAEAIKIMAFVALALILAVATRGARQLLARAAHTTDYAEALESSRRHLEEATRAKERAETAAAELDRHKAELVEQNMRFDAALGNMSMGLCMFDKDQRLVVCNSHYIEMYGLDPELAKPGTHFREIIEARIKNGLWVGDKPEDYLSERLSSAHEMQRNTKVQELSDGRIIAVMHEPMPQGGWVATHEDITQLRRIEAQMQHMARHDALTDLPNRAELRDFIRKTLDQQTNGEPSLVVLLFDIDRFKEVNDTFGPSVGDELLQAVAQRLKRRLKGVEMIARIGGDEFVLVQSAEKPATAASTLARKVQTVLATSFDLDDHQIVVSTSIGIAIGPGDGADPDELLKNADLALNRAKMDAPGSSRFFEREMDQKMQTRRTLERDLRSALHAGELELYYQPQLNLERNEISGMEALVRWNHPERGLVSPADFIPLAEETGLIVQIGEWTLRQACAEASKWPKGLKVAVNLSPAQFRFGNVRHAVISALGASQLTPQRLELEVTESLLLQESEGVAETLEKLHEIGVRFALDDFGTGYSSLSYLSRYHFDKIKIDQIFVKELAERPKSSLAILRSIVALGTSLGIATCAEGIETVEQLEQVKQEGCTEAQGYYVSPPRPAADIPDVLARFKVTPERAVRRAG
jgi:diguanylate cyclase (GGDEF)-like protein